MSSPTNPAGYMHQIERAEVRAAIETAEQVVAWARGVLNPVQGNAISST